MKYFLLAVAFFAISTIQAQTIINPSFEEWSADQEVIEIYRPIGWFSWYDYSSEDDATLRSDKDDKPGNGRAQDGNYSVLVQRTTYFDQKTVYPLVQKIAYADFTQNIFTGYYQADLVEKDSAAITVSYVKANGNVLSTSSFYIKESASTWQMFTVKLKKNVNADSIELKLTSSMNDETSIIWVDNVKFDAQVGVDENTGFVQGIYPNPVSNGNTTLFFNDLDGTQLTVKLLNTQGQEIETVFNGESTTGSLSLPLELSHLSTGIYILQAVQGNSIKTEKLIIH